MKRVLVLHGDLLLSAGLEILLAQETDLYLMSVFADDTGSIGDQVDRLRPDVVVFDDSLENDETSTIVSILKNHARMCAVLVKVHENRMHIYTKQELPVTGHLDLVTAVRDGTTITGKTQQEELGVPPVRKE